MFDHTIRVGDEKVQQSTGARPPVKGVHNDYTETSAPRRLREIVGDAEAERRLKKRWAIIQVWRPIRGKVMIDPLGICDGRTIPQKGFILVQRRYKYRTGEVYHIAYDPEHVWFYFPQMERNEALVFKVFDTDQSVPRASPRIRRSTIRIRRRSRRRARASRRGRSRSGIERFASTSCIPVMPGTSPAMTTFIQLPAESANRGGLSRWPRPRQASAASRAWRRPWCWPDARHSSACG